VFEVAMPGEVPIPTEIIHMTHVDNVEEILRRGELQSTALLNNARVGVTSIAYTSIQEQRAAKHVPCGPGGCLHDYVPFYFCRRSPMLYTVNRGNVACNGGQDSLVHIVSTAQKTKAAGLGFVFSDGHGIMSYTEFYDDLGQLDTVDWNVIAARYWHDTQDDGDRKRRRQAEFLVRDRFPLGLVTDIVVRTDSMRERVKELCDDTGFALKVTSNANWYY
jgi:hypothetical protein